MEFDDFEAELKYMRTLSLREGLAMKCELKTNLTFKWGKAIFQGRLIKLVKIWKDCKQMNGKQKQIPFLVAVKELKLNLFSPKAGYETGRSQTLYTKTISTVK